MRQLISILVIVGPTASGKTARAIDEALSRNGEVISADSRQVYRGFDVTTCKATPEEMHDVPHHLMSFVDPTTVYTVSDFKRDADAAIADIHARGKLPILAGGTGFYIDAVLFEGGFAEVPPDPTLRAQLASLPNETLLERIKTADPRRAATLDPHNTARLIRAVEIIKALGSVPEQGPRAPRYSFETIVLTPSRDELRARLRARVESRLDAIIAEIDAARDMLTPEIAGRLGFAVTLVLQHLNGALTHEQLAERIVAAEWQYARRQQRWFLSYEPS